MSVCGHWCKDRLTNLTIRNPGASTTVGFRTCDRVRHIDDTMNNTEGMMLKKTCSNSRLKSNPSWLKSNKPLLPPVGSPAAAEEKAILLCFPPQFPNSTLFLLSPLFYLLGFLFRFLLS